MAETTDNNPNAPGKSVLLTRRRVVGAIVVAAFFLLPQFAGIPSRTLFAQVLHNYLHVPWFLVVTMATVWGVHRWLPLASSSSSTTARWSLIAAILLVLGLGTELIQAFTDRFANIADAGRNLTGAAIALCLWFAVKQPDRRGRWLVAGAVILGLSLVPLARAADAYLTRNERAPQLYWGDDHASAFFLRSPGAIAQPTSAGLLVLFTRGRGGRFPGLHIDEPVPDWRGFSHLCLDLTPGLETRQLSLRIHDWQHNQASNDRFQRHFVVTPHRRERLQVSVRAIAEAPRRRTMDLHDIAGVRIYGPPGLVGGSFVLHKLFLSRGAQCQWN